MAINYELINKGGISLGTNFELLSEKPLDSRLVVPSLAGLQNYIDNAAAYEGMIVFDKDTKKTYQVQVIDGVLSYREFGINENELKDLIASETTAAMEFKGATAVLPEEPSKGDMWKVTAEFKIDDADVKVGDSIVYNGEEWFIIPSGDDIEDTWRPVDGVANDATLKFAAGDKLDVVVTNDGTITYSHEAIDAPELLAENEQTRTYITAVETDGHGHITGYKTATENVEDTNTEYTFESQVENSSVYFNVTPNGEGAVEQSVYVDAYSKNEVDEKVKALNLEIYGNEAVQETSRIDTAVADAAEAKSTAGTAASDAATAKSDAAEALRIAGEANTAASNAKDGAAASAAAAAASAEAAATSASSANGSAEAAATSESNAAASATTASQKATAASQSADAAAQAKADAEAAQALASGYATAASESATAASGAKEAAIAAQGAAESARDEAIAKANAAASSAEEAAGSASDAAKAQAAAEAAQAAAEASNTSATAIANEAKASAEAAVETADEAKALADTAIQDVENVADNGLVLTKTADNKVSIDWDPNVVLVFNCGSSTELVD